MGTGGLWEYRSLRTSWVSSPLCGIRADGQSAKFCMTHSLEPPKPTFLHCPDKVRLRADKTNLITEKKSVTYGSLR